MYYYYLYHIHNMIIVLIAMRSSVNITQGYEELQKWDLEV